MREPISLKRVLFEAEGMEAVIIRRDVEFAEDRVGAVLALDVYTPPEPASGPRPAVVIISGFPDEGFRKRMGCRFKEMESSISWARLIAASGITAITYTNRDPATDALSLFRALREKAALLEIDAERIGVWASSGNVPVALSLLMTDVPVHPRCAVLCYGYTFDAEEVSRMFGFANPVAGRSVHDLRSNIPSLVVRCGRDECPRLNDLLDVFVRESLAANIPLTLVNHPEAPHAFDLLHDSDRTREIVRQIVEFLRFHLVTSTRPSTISHH